MAQERRQSARQISCALGARPTPPRHSLRECEALGDRYVAALVSVVTTSPPRRILSNVEALGDGQSVALVPFVCQTHHPSALFRMLRQRDNNDILHHMRSGHIHYFLNDAFMFGSEIAGDGRVEPRVIFRHGDCVCRAGWLVNLFACDARITLLV